MWICCDPRRVFVERTASNSCGLLSRIYKHVLATWLEAGMMKHREKRTSHGELRLEDLVMIIKVNIEFEQMCAFSLLPHQWKYNLTLHEIFEDFPCLGYHVRRSSDKSKAHGKSFLSCLFSLLEPAVILHQPFCLHSAGVFVIKITTKRDLFIPLFVLFLNVRPFKLWFTLRFGIKNAYFFQRKVDRLITVTEV